MIDNRYATLPFNKNLQVEDWCFIVVLNRLKGVYGVSWKGGWRKTAKASQKNMFRGSSGSISRTVCTLAAKSVSSQVPRQHGSRQQIPERELIVRTPISTSASTALYFDPTMACPNCGTFRKSGRVSCCAPGGAWFKHCGGLGTSNVDYSWDDGVATCKRKFMYNYM